MLPCHSFVACSFASVSHCGTVPREVRRGTHCRLEAAVSLSRRRFDKKKVNSVVISEGASCSCGCSAAAALLALVVQKMTVASCRPGEFSATVGTRCLCCLAGLLSLVPQEVAKGRELATVAAVLPTLGLGSALDDANVAVLRWGRSTG